MPCSKIRTQFLDGAAARATLRVRNDSSIFLPSFAEGDVEVMEASSRPGGPHPRVVAIHELFCRGGCAECVKVEGGPRTCLPVTTNDGVWNDPQLGLLARSPKPASRQGLYVTRRVVVVMAGVRREEGRGKDASMSMGALADNGKQGRDERDEMASRSHAP